MHCLLALTMQVILQKRPKPKAGAWERQQVGQRASKESTQGNRTSFLFSFPTHTTLKARKEINTQSQRRWPPMTTWMKRWTDEVSRAAVPVEGRIQSLVLFPATSSLPNPILRVQVCPVRPTKDWALPRLSAHFCWVALPSLPIPPYLEGLSQGN